MKDFRFFDDEGEPERHPAYGLDRDDQDFEAGDDVVVDHMLKGGGRGQNRQRVPEGLEPPYEQMFDHQEPSGSSLHGVPPGFEMSVKGKGHGDHGQHQDASLPRPWQGLNQGTGSAMLNGTERLDSGAGISELQGNPRVQGEARQEQQSGWDMELLLHQLLQQNSALQRELSEVRLGSAVRVELKAVGHVDRQGLEVKPIREVKARGWRTTQ